MCWAAAAAAAKTDYRWCWQTPTEMNEWILIEHGIFTWSSFFFSAHPSLLPSPSLSPSIYSLKSRDLFTFKKNTLTRCVQCETFLKWNWIICQCTLQWCTLSDAQWECAKTALSHTHTHPLVCFTIKPEWYKTKGEDKSGSLKDAWGAFS